MWRDNLSQDVSPASILTRDLLRLSKWSKHDDSLDEEDESEVKTTLQSLQGTDLLAQYMAELTKQTAAHQKLLQVLRKAEAEEADDGDRILQRLPGTSVGYCLPTPRLLSVKHQPYSSFHLIVL